MRSILQRLLVCCLSIVLLAPSLAARPVTPAEKRQLPWSGYLPLCEDPAVFAKIQKRFSQAEHQYWGSGLALVAVDQIRETGYRTTGIDYIPRRYCSARTYLNDGTTTALIYWIGEDLGFSGGDYFGWLLGGSRTNLFEHWGVTFRVSGLDRSLTYGPKCRSARP